MTPQSFRANAVPVQQNPKRMSRQVSSIKLVAMDFDLTIYDHSRPIDTLRLQSGFEGLSRAGIMLGLASGRSVNELKSPLEEIGFSWGKPFPDFVICNEGEIRLPDGSDWPGAQVWNSNRGRLVLQTNTKLLPCFEKLVDWASRQGFPIIRDISSDVSGMNVVFETPYVAEEACLYLRKMLSDFPEVEISRNHHIVLALPRQASKGMALAKLAELLGLQAKQVLAIGDNINDLSMLSKDSGFTVATVANADTSVRCNVEEAGGFIADKAISLGVNEIFLHYFSSSF